MIDGVAGQRYSAAVAELAALGVADVGVDNLRQVGRGVRDAAPSMDQSCGNCASGVLAVAPDGTVWPCVFSRWLPVGNVRDCSLPAILDSAAVLEVRGRLSAHFRGVEVQAMACRPECKPTCTPCSPRCKPELPPQLRASLQPELLTAVQSVVWTMSAIQAVLAGLRLRS